MGKVIGMRRRPGRPREQFEDNAINAEQAAVYLGYDSSTVYRMAKAGEIPCNRRVRQGCKKGSVRFYMEDLRAWKEATKTVPEVMKNGRS